MKKNFCILLCLLMLLPMMGCHSTENNSIPFYYCRSPENYQYFEEDGVIDAEYRELLSHRNDLRYMVGLYLAGPLEANLKSPFPKTARLISLEKIEDSIRIELTTLDNSLTDSEFTLACACLTLTCLDFTQCADITITSGGRTVTMDRSTILLFDVPPQQETNGG